MQTKILCLLVIVGIIIFGSVIYFNLDRTTAQINKYKCPETYTEDVVGVAEYRDTITSWTSEFFKENPNATMSDWSMAKTKLWVDNNCTIAIQRSKMSGTFSDLKPWERIDYEIQKMLQINAN
jgi:hypothetical protein